MGRNPKLSEEQKKGICMMYQNICRRYKTVAVYSQLASAYGTPMRTIFDVLEEAGLMSRGPRLSKNKREKICKEYQDGESSYQLAKDYGISRQAILSLLKRREITIRRETPTPDEEKEIYYSFCEGLAMHSLRRKHHRGNEVIRKIIGKYNLFSIVDLYSKCMAGVKK